MSHPLPLNFLKTLFVAASATLAAPLAGAGGLGGEAESFQLFSLTDMEISNTQPGGAVAAGGDFTAFQCSIGAGLTPGTGPVVAAAGNVTFANGSLHNGTIFVGGTSDIAANTGLQSTQTVNQAPPIDFSEAGESYRGLSDRLANLAPTGDTVVFGFGGIELTGLQPGLNVFEISESEYEASNGIAVPDFDPELHTILINVRGTNVVRGNNGTIFVGQINAPTNLESLANSNDLSRHRRILWNFPDARSLVSNNSIHGTILAPRALLTHNNGRLIGQVVAREIDLNNAAEISQASLFDGVLFSLELIAYD